ncbi:MAG TPA: GH116 family glycosyl hydrolase [Phycisphaerae bacterium]|nr:GH116 family glycosyl hydrolase [Phycisphaerae bacterium]
MDQDLDHARHPARARDVHATLDRWEPSKTAAAGIALLSAALTYWPTLADPPMQTAADVKHFVPADKRLSPEWVHSLFDKGNTRVYRGDELSTIGMPIGGIAAGQLYLCGDGTLGCWQIFNRRYFSGYGRDNYQYRTPEKPVEQGFAVIVSGREEGPIRRLDRAGFPGVEFIGEYPIGRVRYAERGFPVKVELEAFSPFIPLNANDSALPATLFHITVENVSAQPVDAGILAWLENAVCFHNATEVTGLRRSRIVNERGRTLIVHTAEPAPEEEKAPPRPKIVLADFEGGSYGDWKATGKAFGDKPATGTLPNQQKVSGFEGEGLVNTFLDGDASCGKLTSPPFVINRRFINFLIGGGNHPGQTCINLLVDGDVVRTATGRKNEQLTRHTWNVAEFEGREARIEIMDYSSWGWGHINIDQIELTDEPRGGSERALEALEDFGSLVLACAEEGQIIGGLRRMALPQLSGALAVNLQSEADVAYALSEKRSNGLLTPVVSLAPKEKRTFTFVLAWHFPNAEHGHAYTNHFEDAKAVAHYMLDNHERLAGDTHKWHDTYYDSTLPHWLLDRLHWPIANLATGTTQRWKNGRFWGWEGVGCCHGTCTHVWNYAHGLARLFPELERSARTMQDLDAAFHDSGLVGFRGQKNNAYAADGQAGTILKCYREHLMSADDSFLRENWPRIKQALEYSIKQDENDDGLIENSQHNTYDINFFGPNTFVGSLYLAALRAGEEMARDVGDDEFAARARQIFESGRQLSVERLWNGEYFTQIVDLQKHPKHQYGEGCLSDQLFGQGWAHQLGLGYIYPQRHVAQALQSVFKYNWTPDVNRQNAAHKPERWFVSGDEPGLFTCTWPKSKHLDQGVRYKNEVWTGIEYQVAGHMIWEGLLDEALIIIRGIHDRYHPLKHNPYNEVECGDHYARALASWGAFLALSGHEYHGPKGHLGFAPRITPENFRAAFTAAEGWGTFAQCREGEKQTEQIDVRWGRLRLKTLAFSVFEDIDPTRVSVEGPTGAVEASHTLDGRRLIITLPEESILHEGETLEVIIG